MFEKKYELDQLNYGSAARTLDPDYIGDNDSGWYIEGKISEDYYEWVNKFKASHPKYGVVLGDFEEVVYATSEKAFNQFLEDHPYSEWDYHDI